MSYKSYLDKQLEDPKFKEEFDRECFIQEHINVLLCSLEDKNIKYDEFFSEEVEHCLKKLYNRNRK